MDDRDRQDMLKEMGNIMQHRQHSREKASQNMLIFADKLFVALEKAAKTANAAGITAYGIPKRLQHPAGNGFSILQLFIEDWKILMIPLLGAARPAFKDEAQIQGALFKEMTGRIVAYIGEDSSNTAFYDFLVFSDGSWFAWGYGWPRQADHIDNTDFDHLAFELLLSFGRDIYTAWSTRAETMLKSVVDKSTPAYEFRVLREDEKK